MILEIFRNIEGIELISTSYEENWSSLTFYGKWKESDKSVFQNLYNEFEKSDLQSSIHFLIDSETLNDAEFIKDLQVDDNWTININKLIVLERKIEDHFHMNFFYSREQFYQWSIKANPFDKNHPLNKYSPIKIIVKDLNYSFGGINIMICDQNDKTSTFDNHEYKLPKYCDVLDVVHVVSTKTHSINPDKHLITFGGLNNYSKAFFKNSAIVLLSCIINEIHEDDKIIIRGVRRLDLDFCGKSDLSIDFEYNRELLNTVQWVYSEKEKRELRLKLLLERITLDVDLQLPFIEGLQFVIKESLQQAKERYSFIVYERKDLYQKELKELLRDLKAISDLYSIKVRTLLSNLLRDVLAAFVLIGISLFSKSTEITHLFDSNLITYVFKAFAGYFLFSAIFQLAIDFFDIWRSEHEFNYWKNVSKEYMTQNEFNNHKAKTLKTRATGSKIIYSVVIACYIIIALICWNFSSIWSQIINQ